MSRHDFAYRPGGEEIVVVLPDRTPQSAGMALERMRRAVRALAIPDSDDSTAVVTMSAGLATRGARGKSCRHVLWSSPTRARVRLTRVSPRPLPDPRSAA